MNHILYHTTILTLLLTAAACSSNSSKSDEIIPEQIISTKFIDDSDINKPKNICVVGDKLAIVNVNTVETLVDLFDNNGQLINSFFKRGEGPLESLYVSNIQYDSNRDVIYVDDCFRKRYYQVSDYDMDSVVIQPMFDFSVKNDRISSNGQFALLKNKHLLATNATTAGMLAIFDNKANLLDTIVPYPDKRHANEQLSDAANIHLYYPYLSISPDRSFVFVAYDTADVRTFITIEGDSINYNVFEDAYPNDLYVFESSPGVTAAAYTLKSRYYTLDNSTSNNYAYQLYSGGLTMEELKNTDSHKDINMYAFNIVKVFDRQGNLKRILELDHPVKAIAVSANDEYLYGLAETSADGYFIVRYEL